MTENKSAMERLRESIRFFDEAFGQTPAQLAHAARAVLAEHDSAQKVPPSERAREWRERARAAIGAQSGWSSEAYHIIEEAVRNWGSAPPVPPSEAARLTREQWHRISKLPAARIAEAVVRRVAEMPDRSSPDDWPEALLVTSDELTDIIIDQLEVLLEATPKVEPSEAAKAWRYETWDAIHRYGEKRLRGHLSVDEVTAKLDEAVRRMSSAEAPDSRDCTISEQRREIEVLKETIRRMMAEVAPTPSAKRLRAGWREDMQHAWDRGLCAEFAALLDEAEASAAPEPKGMERAIEITALKTEIRRLLNQVDRANRIIDALLARKP